MLDTKFHIPKLAAQVVRTRLLKRIKEAGENPLVLVRAPAGFGKTTLLSQWIIGENRQADTAWVSLSRGDNTPARFWQAVVRSFLALSGNHFDPADQLVRSGQTRCPENLVLCLIRCMDRADRDFTLALDDFHLISNPGILDGLNFLVDHPAARLRIMIATRKTPDLGLSRLRLTDRLVEITQADLAFNPGEIRQLSRVILSRSLDDRDLAALQRDTEGWAAALKLTILSRKDRDGPRWDAGGTRMIRDYFMEEVFHRLPGEMQEILPCLSILDRFCPDLVRCISHRCRATAKDPIAYMAGHHLFLIPLDDSGTWFRFHHLFQEFLQKELGRKGEDETAALHTAASEWFRAEGILDPAFDHALGAGRYDMAARVLGEHAPELYGRSGDEGILPYLDQLPEEAVLAHPVLAAYACGIRVFNGEFSAIDVLRLDLGDNPEERRLVKGAHRMMTAYRTFYCTGDLDATIDLGRQAMALIPEHHASVRRILDFLLTLAFQLTGRFHEARPHAMPRPEDNLLTSALNAMNASHLDMEIGDLSSARQRVDREIAALDRIFPDNPPPIYGFLYITRAMIHHEDNQHREAEILYQKGFSVIGEAAYPEFIIISLGGYAVFLADIGEFTRAVQAADQAIALARMGGSWIEAQIQAQKRYVRLRQGRPDLVADWAETVCPPGDQPFQYIPVHTTAARYWIQKQNWPRALALLDPLIAATEPAGCFRRLMECCLLKARAVSGMGRDGGPWLVQALSLAGDHGYPALFLAEMPGMESLFQTLIRQGKIDAAGLHPDVRASLDREGDTPVNAVRIHESTETFNDRELEILTLFHQGASNREAAEALFLSVNTVRWYASRIFAKLGVKRRGQAVSEAVRLKLISGTV